MNLKIILIHLVPIGSNANKNWFHYEAICAYIRNELKEFRIMSLAGFSNRIFLNASKSLSSALRKR